MNKITPEQLLTIIGELTVQNRILTSELQRLTKELEDVKLKCLVEK